MASGNSKKMELKLGRAGITIVVLGMAILLFSVFLLGVVVGKNIDTYPQKIASIPQKALAVVWQKGKANTSPDVADNKKVEGEPKAPETPVLTFYNDLTTKKGEVKDESLTEKKMVETPPPKIDLPPPNAEDEKATVGSGLETPKKIAVVAKTFIIQVASLKDKAKANQVSKSITSLGFKARVVKIDIKGKGSWFRVIVSGFDDRVQAQAAADKITKKMKTTCIIRQASDEKKTK
jgi:cell division protein FtsN